MKTFKHNSLIEALEQVEETITLQEMEYNFLWVVLKRNNFLRLPTARQLGMSIRSLRNKIHLLRLTGFDVPDSPVGTPKRVAEQKVSGKFFRSLFR